MTAVISVHVSALAGTPREIRWCNARLVCTRTDLHDFGVDFVKLCAFVPLPAELLVPRVLFPERVEQLYHLRLSQQLLLHGTPGWT